MSITSMIGELFRPVSNIVDELHTSEEEKFKIKKEMAKLESDIKFACWTLKNKWCKPSQALSMLKPMANRGCNAIGGPLPCSPFLFMVVCDSFGF